MATQMGGTEQTAPQADGAEMPMDEAETAGEEKGFVIEIEVDASGAITVSLEDASQESAEGAEDESQATPAKNIADALRIARQIYEGETGEGPSKAAWDQEAAARQSPPASGV